MFYTILVFRFIRSKVALWQLISLILRLSIIRLLYFVQYILIHHRNSAYHSILFLNYFEIYWENVNLPANNIKFIHFLVQCRSEQQIYSILYTFVALTIRIHLSSFLLSLSIHIFKSNDPIRPDNRGSTVLTIMLLCLRYFC